MDTNNLNSNVYRNERRKCIITVFAWLIVGFLLLEVIPLVPGKELPIRDSETASYLKKYDAHIYSAPVPSFDDSEDDFSDKQTIVYDSSHTHLLVTTGDRVTVDEAGNTVVTKGMVRLSLARALGSLPILAFLVCLVFLLPLISMHKKTHAIQSEYTEHLWQSKGIEEVRRNYHALCSTRSTCLIIGIILFSVYIILMLMSLFGYDFIETFSGIDKEHLNRYDFLFGKTYPLYESSYQLSNGVTIYEVTSHLHSPYLGGWLTGSLYDLFYHLPVLGADMTSYVQMIISPSSLVLFGTLCLYPAILFGSLAKSTKRDMDRYTLQSALKREERS